MRSFWFGAKKLLTTGGLMQRLYATIVMLLLTLLAGCQPHAPGAAADGYAVMFEGQPSLSTTAVYYQGVEIGEIAAVRAGAGNIIELKVIVDSEFQGLMTEDAVFYPSAGHLEYNRLSPAGGPLEDGAALLGFSSKLAYVWYRVSTALSSRRAAEKARMLQAKLQWGEPVEIAL
jgi:hypothetical protein